jgi:enoyl-CoA hydratase/carnithine racemase
VPTIAALNGFVTGGGAAIAGACTVRIGAEDIKVGVPIARTLGNCLAISNLRRFIALVGEPRVTYMLVTANLIDAAEAHSAGFISELLPDRDAVIARARALGEEIAAFAPLSIQASREGIRRLRVASPLPDDSDLIKLCYESADFKEGMTAFFEKRQPDWRGE